MVIGFLLFTLGVGLYYSGKITTLREYAIGHKQFATPTLVATVLATSFGGGGLIRTVEQVHGLGLYWAIIVLFDVFCVWLISPLALRMAPFMQHLSIAETMGAVYGKLPRIITALASIGTSIASLAIQINVMTLAMSICLESVNPRMITIFATLALIFYSTSGGIRAVTFTDVLQFVTFAVVIPLLAWYMLKAIHIPMDQIIPFLQDQDKFQFSSLFRLDTQCIRMLALMLACAATFIDPPVMQRLYMCSGPIQANKVFFYSGIFFLCVQLTIVSVALFVFVEGPDLAKTAVWPYIIAQIPPVFQGMISISLLAMTMSTADSKLNSCAVMVSHDLLPTIQKMQLPHLLGSIGHVFAKIIPHSKPLRLARCTSLVVGLSAMMLAFYCTDLLQLLLLAMALSVPIIPAPFILAIFGFRGSARTAIMGMVAGVLSIWAWNRWVEPRTDIDGSFVSMMVNGLVMMAAHYLLPQPPDRGWIAPDDEFKQIQQARARKKARQKQAFFSLFLKESLAKLQPNNTTLVFVGIYTLVTSLLTLAIVRELDHLAYWFMFQMVVGAALIGYVLFLRHSLYVTQRIPDWVIGPCWLITVGCCVSINIIWQLHFLMHTLFAIVVTFIHLATTLWVLPIYWGIGMVAITLLAALIMSPTCYMGPFLIWPSGESLLPMLALGLFIFGIIIYTKGQVMAAQNETLYFKEQEKLRQEKKLQHIAYQFNIHAPSKASALQEDSGILQKVVQNVTQSITFLDEHPLYKEDFQSIINKFSQWALFLKKQAKSQDHILLLPTEITLDALMEQVEIAVESAYGQPIRFLIEKQERLPTTITCDVKQMIHLLVTAILHIIHLEDLEKYFLKVELSATQLQYETTHLDVGIPSAAMDFPAVAIRIRLSNCPAIELPAVQNHYKDITKKMEISHSGNALEKIQLTQKKIERIIRAHYGYVEMGHPKAILMVLPSNVIAIREEMIGTLPMEAFTSEDPITPKEQGDSMMALMEFHDYVCQTAEVDPGVIAEILLLLRRCYGFKRHPSGALFYMRAAGIAKLVATWIFHSPKPIYAALLYDLVRYTRLPLSYIKANYDRGIFCFVQHVLHIDTHQEMAASLFHIENRLKTAIQQSHLSVLYIKLAERLYDLGNAAGYAHIETVKAMAKETLMVDIGLASAYLAPEIAIDLEVAAKKALTHCTHNGPTDE